MNDQGTVAVLGAGSTMGLGMARNIARSGIAVRGWNRTAEKARPLEGDGAEIFDTAREAVDAADVVLTMLADADAVIDAIEDVAPSAGSDTLWLQMSTIGEAGTDRCAEVAQTYGLTLIVANSWVLTVVEGVAETFALAEGLGLDPQLLLDAIEGGALDLPYLRMKGKSIMERSFEPSFRLSLAAKDARLIEESAQRHELDVPLFSTIRRRLDEGAKEHGDEDFSATYWTSATRGDGA